MTLSSRVAAHLPLLRRYARSVTGSQTSGDAFVAATLQAMIEDVTLFPDTGSDRVSLYKLFSDLYRSANVEVPPAESPFGWESRAQANLQNVPPAPRQAFLLSAVEDFNPGEIATVLGVETDDVAGLMAEASELISKQVATDILIIEDEPLIAMDIEHMVESLGHRVTGIARTHSEAIELYNNDKPKMVLADIQLADGSSGIDAVNDILRDSDIPVIFITAYPERLLTGERPEPTFLVTKPFNEDMVKALISQALFFEGKKM